VTGQETVAAGAGEHAAFAVERGHVMQHLDHREAAGER